MTEKQKTKHILADMHTHLHEKKLKPTDWWDEVRKKDLKVVAITEHVEYDPKGAYEELAREKHQGILLIPGFEAKTSAGHLLVYGKDSSIYDIKPLQKVGVPIEEALEEVQKNGLVASFAHPFGYKTDSVCWKLGETKTKSLMKKYGTGCEYYNGMLGSANGLIFGTQWVKKLYNFFDFTSKSKLGRALHIANKSRKLKENLEKISKETFQRVQKGILLSQNAPFITVGSDAHHTKTIGTAVIELANMPHTAKEFCEMIKYKKILWAGPNMNSKEPVDRLKKKELLEGLKYITKKKLQRKIKKPRITKRIRKKFPKIKKKMKEKLIG